MIIGIVGKKGSGKTTLADILTKQFKMKTNWSVHMLAFADSLKEMLIKADICTYNEVYVEKTPFSRMMMQKVGTNIFRNLIDKDYWTKRLMMKISDIREDFGRKSIIIVHDVRFLNEASFLRSMHPLTQIIKINRNIVSNDIHPSEAEMDKIRCDYTFENYVPVGDSCSVSTIPELERLADEWTNTIIPKLT